MANTINMAYGYAGSELSWSHMIKQELSFEDEMKQERDMFFNIGSDTNNESN